MKIIIYNAKLEDEVRFTIKKLDEETKLYIFNQIHARGWEKEDCFFYSEEE